VCHLFGASGFSISFGKPTIILFSLFSWLILIVMNIIFYIHLLLFLTVLIVPFLKNKELLELYSILIPFIFYHWSVNDDTCALTQMEMYVTGNSKEETFFGRIMGPIYKMDDTDANNLLKTVMFGLWLFVQYKLGRVVLA